MTDPRPTAIADPRPWADLHSHSHFSFLDGASSVDAMVQRAVELGMSALALTDHQGLYGAVRFSAAAEAAKLRPILGVEIELLDSAVPDPHHLVVPIRRGRRRTSQSSTNHGPAPTTDIDHGPAPAAAVDGVPVPIRVDRVRAPGHREPKREDLRGVRDRERGPHLVLLCRDQTGWESLCRLVSAAHLDGTKGVPRFTHQLLARHAQGVALLTGCRHGEVARRLLAGDRAGARAAMRWYTEHVPDIPGLGSGVFAELQHHLDPDDDLLVAETATVAADMGLPTIVTGDAHYALPEDRELQDVLVAIRHGRTVEQAAHLRRHNGEYHLASRAELEARPPATTATDAATRRAWTEGLDVAAGLAARCHSPLREERRHFPAIPIPDGRTTDEQLAELCWSGVRSRYVMDDPAVSAKVGERLSHELDVIGRTHLAGFFLVCEDLVRFARERGIPAQGRGSAGDSIVAYALGITRVDPIRHDLLFERFINEGRVAYPDIDIDFASSRREEVIQYVYQTYGVEHTGMVANLVTYRARSAVREVGTALGFPGPLVDRVAKALETYDSVMVRRDLEADGGFAEMFRQPGGSTSGPAAGAAHAERRGLVDGMGQLDHRRTRPMRAPTPRAPRLAGRSDDEGGPGDTPVSEAWIRGTIPAHPVDAESGMLLVPDRAIDGSSVARVEPEPPPMPRGGSIADLSPWERWLELCARLDGFPRHLSIHVGGMLVTREPLVSIAPLERATMPGRVVIQWDKRDVESLGLVKLDLLGLRMLSSIDEAIRLVAADCGIRLDLDALPEDLPEVYDMIVAADTVGVFQVESRAQMQALPKARPDKLDDLIVQVAIIRPGPIQGNAVHPYLRRRQGIEPVAYLHPSLAPILKETLGVILYQEQVMRIAIDVAGFSAADSDGFRRAMGTWRSSKEMEKLHARFVDGCVERSGLTSEQAEELYRQAAAFASFGFNKSHAAAFARTAYESAFLKLYYPAQFVAGLINAQPMGFYPVEVLVNDARRHGCAVLPVDINQSRWRTTTEWIGMPGVPLPPGSGITRRPVAVRSPACVVPGDRRPANAVPEADAYAIRLGLCLVKGIGEEIAERLDAELDAGPYRSLEDVVARTGLSEEVIERLIRAGGLDSLGRPRRELLWQLREVAGSARPGIGGRAVRDPVAGRPLGLRLPATPAPDLPPPSELERLGDSYAILSLDARRQVTELFRPALDRLGAVTNAALATHRPGRIRIGGLVVTRQHPMTARGTVFLALEDETGMANVTLWPSVWAELRGVVRRHALLLVDGELQREGAVVNVVARGVRSLAEASATVGGPLQPTGVRQLGYAGMRRVG
jgi:error-prone DNA polymerase